MLKFKKIVVLLVILLLLVGIAVQVQASNTLNLDDLLNSNTTSNTTTNTTANTTTNTTTNTTRTNTLNVTGNSIVQPNTNRAGSSENSLPQTGVTEDITVMFFIVVCIIAAIYAYKKIRDYKA